MKGEEKGVEPLCAASTASLCLEVSNGLLEGSF